MGFIIECNTLVTGTVGFFFLQGKMSVKRASWPLPAKLYLEFTEIIVSPHLNPQKISKNKVCLDFIDEDCFHTRTRGKCWLNELPKAYLREQCLPILMLLQRSFPLSFLSWMCLDLICRVPIDPGAGHVCTVETVSHDLLNRPCDSLFVSQTLFSQ